MNSKIALVNQNDEIIGYEDKQLVHLKGILHRAFSIVIYNQSGEMLLQKRASDKYHSGGLWTNTCCSHLVETVDFEEYLHQRLKYEMGFDCELIFHSKFHYKVKFESGLFENEIDHLYTGKWIGIPCPNMEEVSEWKWEKPEIIIKNINSNPENYTYWFKEIMKLLNLLDEPYSSVDFKGNG
jgi:isopentenyl-diphosphate delta-isomerase